jgi:two-component system phosphate regulon sensor histidine kinase PhoR
MLYVAVRLPGTGNAPAVVRLAKPMTAVRETSQGLRSILLIAFALAVVLVWVVSLVLAGALTAPVQSLVRIARRVDRGDLQARAEDVKGGELGELAAVFNSALDRLSQLVASSQRESRYYAAILEQMSDAVVIVDQRGDVQFINPIFARLFGVEADQAEGRTSEQIALNYQLSSLLRRAVEQKAVQRDEVRVLHPETRLLAMAATPLVDERGEVIGAIGLLRDVTDLRRLDEVRREFVSNASHELRTPAAGVKALAEALQAGAFQDPEKGPRFVQQIVEAADRLTNILDDMLTLTRVERGQELLNATWLSAAEAIAEAAEQIRPAAQGKGVGLEVEAPAEDRLYADAAGLHTVLVNLLDNAVKYTPAEGTVSLRGRPVPGGYEVSVADTGLGIPEEHLPRIFERFYRVDKARDRASGGTGLGLAIVKHTVETHNGRVTVRSAPGEGATFTVFFPNPQNGAQ